MATTKNVVDMPIGNNPTGSGSGATALPLATLGT